MPRIVQCPNCGKDVVWTTDNPYRPFCSARCKGIDLGKWATEENAIKVEITPDLLEDEETVHEINATLEAQEEEEDACEKSKAKRKK